MSLHDVFIQEMRDLYNAENQLLKALPKLAKATRTPELKSLFTAHLEETKAHVERLRGAFERIGKKPTGEHCHAMEGLVEEGKEAIQSEEEGEVKDIELIGAGLRVEHYEIAGYTALIAIAKTLDLPEIAASLAETLKEETAAGKKLLAQGKLSLKTLKTAQDAAPSTPAVKSEGAAAEPAEPGEPSAPEASHKVDPVSAKPAKKKKHVAAA